MKVTADKVSIGTTSVMVGVQVRGPQDDWVQFHIVRIPFDMFTLDDLAQITAGLRVSSHKQPADEPMF